jgi:hypothetical protein
VSSQREAFIGSQLRRQVQAHRQRCVAATGLGPLAATENAAATLERALGSVLAQNMAEIEIIVIVIDDGSTDDTPGILAQVAAADGRLRVLTQANVGVRGRAMPGSLRQRPSGSRRLMPTTSGIPASWSCRWRPPGQPGQPAAWSTAGRGGSTWPTG